MIHRRKKQVFPDPTSTKEVKTPLQDVHANTYIPLLSSPLEKESRQLISFGEVNIRTKKNKVSSTTMAFTKEVKAPIQNGTPTNCFITHQHQSKNKLLIAEAAKEPCGTYSNDRGSKIALVGAAICAVLYTVNRNLSRLDYTRVVTLLPIALSLYTGVRPGLKFQQRIIPLSLVLSVIGTQLPVYLACGIATGALMAFSLATMPMPDSDVTTKITKARGMPDFMLCLYAAITMTVVLLTENFLIWVLSATFEPGQNPATTPPPLQDNGKSIIKYFFSSLSSDEVIGMRRMWNTQWALVVCLGVSFLVVELYHPVRSLYSVGTRAFLTISVGRFARTISFMLTVVPSQIEGCYDLRFPNPPPSEWKDWILVGFLPRTKGGCNDLIISGHSIIMSTIACVATSVANDRMFSIALWSMVFLDYTVVVYEGLHYSVDMFLGVTLITLLWIVSKPLERPTEMPAVVSTHSTRRNNTVTVRNAAWYAPPAVVAYLQLVVLPIWAANFVILLYVVIALAIFFKFVLNETSEVKKQPFMHYMQHIVLCLVFLALGIYL